MSKNNEIKEPLNKNNKDTLYCYKLREIANVYDGTHQTPNYKKIGVPFVSVENINNLYSTNKYISIDDYNFLYPIKPQTDDVLMTRIGDIGTPALIKDNRSLAFYVSLALIRIKSSIILPEYLYYYIQTKRFKKELWNRTIHNAFPIKINKNEIGNCRIFIPNLNYQKNIIGLFKIVDKKIDIINSKLSILKKYKEGIKKYVIKDTIRFWKTGTGNASELKKYLFEKNEYCIKNGIYPHITLSTEGITDKSERYDRDFLVKNEDKKYKITHLNQLCYNPSNLKFGVICINKYGNGMFSPIYITFDINNIVTNYLELIITSNDFINYSMKYQQGTVFERMAVSSNDLCKIKIVTTSFDEQHKIAKVADTLNKKISKLEDELLSLKHLKSTLLNDMFI